MEGDSPGEWHTGVGGGIWFAFLDRANTVTIGVASSTERTLRVSGKKVWGTFPFHESAFIGGASTLRGWPKQRFAGDAALYGNAELRLFLTKFFLVLPGDFGVFGLADPGCPVVWEFDWTPGIGPRPRARACC